MFESEEDEVVPPRHRRRGDGTGILLGWVLDFAAKFPGKTGTIATLQFMEG